MPNSNFLSAENLLRDLEKEISDTVTKLKRPPTLALVWVGDDKQTERFVKAKQKKANDLGINFQLHRFDQTSERQLSAVIMSLAANKDVDGIIVQLPLPSNITDWKLLQLIPADKDVDHLNDGPYSSPTAEGIVKLLAENQVDLSKLQTVILGSGRLVGRPLADIFRKNNWPFQQISSDAQEKTKQIKTADVLIGATGIERIIGPAMVSEKMVVVDGSGVDVDLAVIGNQVRLVTPAKGTVGPLTVMLLLRNVTEAARHRQDNSK